MFGAAMLSPKSAKTDPMDVWGNMIKMEVPDVAQCRNFSWPDSLPEHLGNGTWYGFNNTFQDEYRRSWAIALVRFVGRYWTNKTLLYQRFEGSPARKAAARPAVFENETGVEAEPTRLYFQAKLSSSAMWETSGLTAYCDVAQNQQNCTVTAQRPSQRRHAPEAITHLSFPLVFRWISKQISPATAVRNTGTCDIALDEPGLDTMSNNVSGAFVDVDEELFSQRLSQVLNTHILLGQMFLRAVGSTKPGKWVEFNWNVTRPVEVYSVTGVWMDFCIFSCIALSAGGILSVFFTHLAIGPDMLGYASTLVRDSRYIKMPAETGQMGGTDMAVEMRDMRIRYGFTGQNSKEQVWVGVGREEETKRIRDYLSQD
ncbi:hypothetical protein N0V84_011772 [Fusarium piperis]|uniref:Uncharacterized protein n=1 Tax=Fusarium piperis TaxID=1435070 RepID=A0A9W8TCR2_9HYPO|nr:hypothetical protein N0V84_011772 [Fusarium piperis]